MPKDVTTTISGFVSTDEVKTRLGCSRSAWSELVKRAGIVLYRHPGNGRKRLVREADAERLMTPRPAEPRATRKSVAA